MLLLLNHNIIHLWGLEKHKKLNNSTDVKKEGFNNIVELSKERGKYDGFVSLFHIVLCALSPVSCHVFMGFHWTSISNAFNWRGV